MSNFKVIHIIHSLAPGGAENLVRLLANHQAIEQGYDVEVITVGSPVNLNSSHYAREFSADLRTAGVRWQYVRLPKNIQGALIQLRPRLSFNDRTVIHCHIFRGLPALWTVSQHEAAVVYTHHNSKYPVPSCIVYKVANSCADAFVSVCQKTQLDAENKFKGPSCVIPNGIDCARYRSRPSDQAPARPIRLVNIGSLTKQKNHFRSLEMMRELGEGYQLDIFGEGPLENALKATVDRFGLRNIHFKGLSSRLNAELSDYDVMVQTSDWEGMPLSLLEGHAAGLPIVATNVGDTGRIVVDQLTGFLVPEDAAPQVLANRIRRAANAEAYEQLSRAAKQRATQFDIEKTASAYSELYKQTAAEKRSY